MALAERTNEQAEPRGHPKKKDPVIFPTLSKKKGPVNGDKKGGPPEKKPTLDLFFFEARKKNPRKKKTKNTQRKPSPPHTKKKRAKSLSSPMDETGGNATASPTDGSGLGDIPLDTQIIMVVIQIILTAFFDETSFTVSRHAVITEVHRRYWMIRLANWWGLVCSFLVMLRFIYHGMPCWLHLVNTFIGPIGVFTPYYVIGLGVVVNRLPSARNGTRSRFITTAKWLHEHFYMVFVLVIMIHGFIVGILLYMRFMGRSLDAISVSCVLGVEIMFLTAMFGVYMIMGTGIVIGMGWGNHNDNLGMLAVQVRSFLLASAVIITAFLAINLDEKIYYRVSQVFPVEFLPMFFNMGPLIWSMIPTRFMSWYLNRRRPAGQLAENMGTMGDDESEDDDAGSEGYVRLNPTGGLPKKAKLLIPLGDLAMPEFRQNGSANTNSPPLLRQTYASSALDLGQAQLVAKCHNSIASIVRNDQGTALSAMFELSQVCESIILSKGDAQSTAKIPVDKLELLTEAHTSMITHHGEKMASMGCELPQPFSSISTYTRASAATITYTDIYRLYAYILDVLGYSISQWSRGPPEVFAKLDTVLKDMWDSDQL